MATKKYRIRSYELRLARQMTIGGGVVKFYAQAVCHGEGGERFVVFFLRPDTGEVDNVYNPDTKWATVYVPADQYPWYVDLLRSERPVFAFVNSDKSTANRLYTGEEPVGEDED